ncbi:hypothetical protein O181_105707 [Austropuccinia psidii MF-1]|uniref:Uncharacterized protein n=1 Tax=Austropuccinia psidii MF-1 TaxID=1389203 RepID=A0A9Q3JP09_9BASI|nr:hypothetical protein [Austropuccinia psidii MF-1]
MEACKAMVIPFTPNENLYPSTDNKIASFKKMSINYRSAIGRINYLSTTTRPYLSFLVSTQSQYLEQSGIKNWQAFLPVLKYLRGSLNRGLYYPVNKNNGITPFRNTNWGNCKVMWQSTTGYLSHFHNYLILLKTQKQPSFCISMEEEEYKAVCDLTSELLWFRRCCKEAKLFVFTDPILIFKDNQIFIKTAND